MVYLVFNEGYSSRSGEAQARAPLCDEAIRLARLLLRLFQTDPEIMGLAALLLLQHARADARFDAAGDVVLLDDQDRALWNRDMIAEGLALIDKALRHRSPGPYQVQAAVAALHARAGEAQDTDWTQIEALYAHLEIIQPSPVVTLNRAGGGQQGARAGRGPGDDRAAGRTARRLFLFLRGQGRLLLQLGRGAEAREAFDRAIALANTASEAAHIRQQLDRLGEGQRRCVKDRQGGLGSIVNPGPAPGSRPQSGGKSDD